MTHHRTELVKAQSLLHEATDDLQGALTLYLRFDPDSQRDFYEYLRDFTKELECAVKTLGGRIVWNDEPTEANVIVNAVIDGLGLERT